MAITTVKRRFAIHSCYGSPPPPPTPFIRACKKISIKMHSAESIVLLQGNQIYCWQACTCALFSPEIVQDGAVKGLRGQRFKCTKTRTCTDIPHPCTRMLAPVSQGYGTEETVKRAKFLKNIRKNREEA